MANIQSRRLLDFVSRFPGRDARRLEALLTLMPTIQRITRFKGA